MLRYSVVVLAGVLAAGPVTAAGWADQMFDELSKDFGSVPRGPALVHHFRFVNSTSSTVNISHLRVSCGCVSATPLKEVLAPGEESAILARMDTTRFVGPKSVTIFVHFNRPKRDEVRLLIQAVGRDDFSITPDTLAFGQVKRSATPELFTTITFLGNNTSQISEVRCETHYVQLTLKETERKPTVVTYVLTAKLRNDAPVGKWYSDIWLKTNVATMPQIRVPLTVEIESALSVSPETVALGTMKATTASERRVIVRGVKPFKITQIESDNNQVEVQESNPDEKKVHVLTVRVKAGQAGELRRNVKLHTNLAEDNEIDFKVMAQVVP